MLAIHITCSQIPGRAQLKEAESTQSAPSSQHVAADIRQGFVYQRVPHVTLGSIANNAEIDVIWDNWHEKLDLLRAKLNTALKKEWQEWEIPREADEAWPESAKKLQTEWWQARIARQKEIDASIAAKAEPRETVRQTLRGQEDRPRCGPFHCRESFAASCARR